MKNILQLLKNGRYLYLSLFLLVILLVVSIYIALTQSQPKQAPVAQFPTVTPHYVIPSVIPTHITEDMYRKQDQGEKAFAESQANIQRNYPWFNKLPLQTSDYFVYFDVEKKVFVGLLYPSEGSEGQIANQVVTMKAEIRNSLTSLGIDVSKYQFEWSIKPEAQ